MILNLELSDYLAICALIISIAAVPLSAYLSYRTANETYLFQELEREIAATLSAKNELQEQTELFGRLFKTVLEDKFGIDLSNSENLKEINSKRHEISKSIYDYGIINDIKRTMRLVSNTKIIEILEKSDDQAYESFIALRLHLNNSEFSISDIVFSCYRTFYEHKTLEALSSITETEIRVALSSQ